MAVTNIVRLVREQCNIVEVVGAYLKLSPAGKNYKSLCPFHAEKTPSFFVSPEKGLWHCFGCGAGGDVIDFVQRMDGLSFAEAVANLGQKLGIRWQPSPNLKREEWLRLRLLQLNRLAMELYERTLWTSEWGEKAQRFLSERGIGKNIARQFRLGYAPPSWDTLVRAIQDKGMPLSEAFQGGLLQRSSDGDGYFDRFRDRLIFPIFNLNGEVVGFGGRSLGNSEVKYLNTPETPLFQKRKCLYALLQAREAIREKGWAILVEGYIDAISLHQSGFTNTVATMGTALNKDTIQIIKRFTDSVVLAYDADAAGLNAILRVSDLFREHELQVRVAALPEGSDPDSFIREQRASSFQICIDRAENLVEFRVRRLWLRYPSAVTEAIQSAAKMLTEIRSEAERNECISKLAKMWSGDQPRRIEELEKALRRTISYQQRRQTFQIISPQVTSHQDPITTALVNTDVVPSGIRHAEKDLMAALVQDKQSAQKILTSFQPDEFLSERYQELARLVSVCLEDNSFDDLSLLVSDLGDDDLRQVLSGLMLHDLRFLQARNAIEDRIARLRRYRLEKEMQQRESKLRRKILTGNLSDNDPELLAWQENLKALKKR